MGRKRRREPSRIDRASPDLARHHTVERVAEVYWPEGTREVAAAERVTHDRVVDADTLDWLKSRRHIEPDQWRAGDLLRSDWHAAGYEMLRAADVGREPIGGGASTAESDARLAAQQRVMDAMRALGKARCGITITVVCAGVRLRAYEQSAAMRTGAALEVIRTALDDLAEHYATRRRM